MVLSPCVLTMVAGIDEILYDKDVDLAREQLIKRGANILTSNFLERNRAIDIVVDGVELHSLEDIKIFGKYDYCLQELRGRFKPLLLTDMDSTVIKNETLSEMLEYAGEGKKGRAITEAGIRGDIDFREGLKERASLLKGHGASDIYSRLHANLDYVSGAKELIKTYRNMGGSAYLVSAGFEETAQIVSKELGYNGHYVNFLGQDLEGKFEGIVEGSVMDSVAKEYVLAILCKEHGLELSSSCAIGDGANDIGMISASGLGVSFYGVSRVEACANASIKYGNLTTLLYFMGIPYERFVN